MERSKAGTRKRNALAIEPQVEAVDQAEDRGRDGDENVEPRYASPTRCPFFHGKPFFRKGPIRDAGIVA